MKKKELKAVGTVYAINWSSNILNPPRIWEYYELNNGRYIYSKHAENEVWKANKKKINDYFLAKPQFSYDTYEEAEEVIRKFIIGKVQECQDILINLNSQLKKYQKYRRKS